MVYDANGNLTSFTDARNSQNPTTFVYDNMDRLYTRTDSLLHTESYQHDPNGNVTQYTDRRGYITSYQYDALNRLTFAGYGTQPGPTYQSSISYNWDAGNRLTQVVDSIAGTTTLGYDDFNRLTSASSLQGAVSYTYDALGRRQSMTVTGQPEVDYTYDSGNRVTKITQGPSVVQIGYDANGRRTSLTLPNGVIANYSYDSGSQLAGIVYTSGGSTLGDLEYTYDGGGRLATMTGSLAHINLPQPVSGASYNTANQLTQFGTSQLTYDANGNITNDSMHTYTWDSRNHLVAVDGGSTASFVYDPFGRRVSKTVYGINTGYLYDGANVVQELAGSSPSAILLSGGRDEIFTRTDSTGAYSFVRDGMGSTAGLTDTSGTLQQTYIYDPYGNTNTSGGASSNSYQYIGRETDATRLYYFRNRYYNPITRTFLSEDPMRLAGGPNLYQYAAGNPTTYSDPNGKFVEGCLIGAVGYEFGQAMQGLAGRKMDKGWNEAKGLAGACALGVVTEGLTTWAAAFADAAEAFGPAAAEAEEAAAAADELGATGCGMCFPAGTLVETRHGRVPIEKIKVDDEVLARNMDTGKLEYKKVIALTKPHQDKLLVLKIEGERTAIRTTPSHPFWVRHAGKAAAWIPAGKMQVGDQVLTDTGKWEKVTEDSPLTRLAVVYNFEVQDDHDYFVGLAGILVHNSNCLFGNQVHQDFQQVLADQTGTLPEDWQMATAPGQTGVDATWIGDGPSPLGNGINNAELKPVNYPNTAVGNQISSWGLPQGSTSIWWYNESGIIGRTLGIW